MSTDECKRKSEIGKPLLAINPSHKLGQETSINAKKSEEKAQGTRCLYRSTSPTKSILTIKRRKINLTVEKPDRHTLPK